MKLEIGSPLEQFYCSTIEKPQVSSVNLVNRKTTMFLFMRFYGCRFTKLAMWKLMESIDSIKKTGGQVVVIVQSNREIMKEVDGKREIPFSVICDPEETLYRKFDLFPAETIEQVLVGANEHIAEAEKLGLKKGKAEGNPLQLPAAVLVDANTIIKNVLYGKSGGDLPAIETVIELLDSHR